MNLRRAWASPGSLRAAALAAALLAGCSSLHYPVNAPLERYAPERGYRLQNLAHPDNSDGLLVMMAFSGGGARAAALAGGVLEELAKQEIVWGGERKRLSDEIDTITAVSGGSITAAWFALHGREGLPELERRFLTSDFEHELRERALSLRSLFRFTSPRYGRIELLAELLDERLFEGKTFSALIERRPWIVITASDMALGGRFEFTQEGFDPICSDLSSYPIARAVAASSAVPLVFSPLTLWNYAGQCGYTPPAWARSLDGTPRKRELVRELLSYADREQRPYIHLLDGGLADNLGIRGLLEAVSIEGGFVEAMRAGGFRHVHKFVYIVVNAARSPDPEIGKSADVPSLTSVTRALATIPLSRYGFESLQLLQASIADWRREVRGARLDGPDAPVAKDIDFYLVNVALDNEPDPAERDYLRDVPTGLQLSEDQSRRIRASAARQLRGSPDLQRLLSEIGAR